jgi:hypothetical protein
MGEGSAVSAKRAQHTRLGEVRRWWTGGLSLSGASSLVAVVAVLVVVSVPRLRRLALQENEADARTTSQLLARALNECKRRDAHLPAMHELLHAPLLEGTLADAELLEHGTLLRRHGYLFEVTQLGPELALPDAVLAVLRGDGSPLADLPAVRAWPWAYGDTGESAFLCTCTGASLKHANSPPKWEGLASAGAILDDPRGWSP